MKTIVIELKSLSEEIWTGRLLVINIFCRNTFQAENVAFGKPMLVMRDGLILDRKIFYLHIHVGRNTLFWQKDTLLAE